MCSGGKRRENAVKVPYFSVGKKKMNCSLLYLPPPLLSRGWFVALSTLMRLVNHKRRTSVKRPPAKSCFCSIWNVTNYKRSLNQLQWADGADPIHLGPNSGACFFPTRTATERDAPFVWSTEDQPFRHVKMLTKIKQTLLLVVQFDWWSGPPTSCHVTFQPATGPTGWDFDDKKIDSLKKNDSFKS